MRSTHRWSYSLDKSKETQRDSYVAADILIFVVAASHGTLYKRPRLEPREKANTWHHWPCIDIQTVNPLPDLSSSIILNYLTTYNKKKAQQEGTLSPRVIFTWIRNAGSAEDRESLPPHLPNANLQSATVWTRSQTSPLRTALLSCGPGMTF